MIQNLLGIISKSFGTQKSTALTAVKHVSGNPFAAGKSTNPFLASAEASASTYGKNNPVRGGYFAGYYNGKPNIVGRRLFLEV